MSINAIYIVFFLHIMLNKDIVINKVLTTLLFISFLVMTPA